MRAILDRWVMPSTLAHIAWPIAAVARQVPEEEIFIAISPRADLKPVASVGLL